MDFINKIKKEIVVVNLSELKPFNGNPRHNNKSADMVAESIKNYGYINPIVVDENNVILAGNTRFKALQRLGVTEIDVLRVSGLTDQEKNGFVIIDNKAGEFSRWNLSALKRMIENCDVDEETLASFGILSISKTKKMLEEKIFGTQKA